MSSPTTPTFRRAEYTFTPSRPAPPPPSYTASERSTHLSHRHQYRSYSTTSLESCTTLFSSEKSPSSASIRQTARSPLNSPLTPTKPKYQSIQNRSISYPTPSPSPKRSYIPAELSLFDHKPRQTLLADIELIIGKKLHFPMLSPTRRKEKERSQKLIKERRISDDDTFWSGLKREEVVVVEKKKGRGVREGNWV